MHFYAANHTKYGLTPAPKLCEMFIHEGELNMKSCDDEMVGDTKVCREETGIAKESALALVRSTEERADGAAVCQTSMIYPTTEHMWRR